MLKYAKEIAGVKAPRLHRVYVHQNARLMVTDYDPGVRLDAVWPTLDNASKLLIRNDL